MADAALFNLAKVCNMTPRDQGECPFPDFLILSSAAEMWMKVEMERPRL